MKRSLTLFSSFVVAAFTVLVLDIAQAHAIGTISDGAGAARGKEQPVDLFGNAGVFSKISSVLLFIVGAIAVIMIVIGGLRYVISGGDASHVQAAKNTILYALVGVIVAILAYAAVNFVVNSFVPSSGGVNSSYGTSTQ
ncbi:MAG: hypothetical protein WAQ25_00460 [Candidatus Saccharimonas sp.]